MSTAKKEVKKTDKLTKTEVQERIKNLKDWKLKGNSLVKIFKTKGFPQTMGLVTAIGSLCQQNDHHPDYLTIKYSTVEVSFSSHDVKGLSLRDVKIAGDINKLKY